MHRTNAFHIFLFTFFVTIFVFNFNLQNANASYFSTVLSGITGTGNSNFGSIFSPIKNLTNFGSGLFGTHSSNQNVLEIKNNVNTTQTNVDKTNSGNPYLDNNRNPYINNDNSYVNYDQSGTTTTASTATSTASTTAQKINSYLNSILEKLGFLNQPQTNSTTPTNINPSLLNNPNLQNPSGANSQNPFLPRDLFGNQTGANGNNSAPNALQKYLPGAPAYQSSPVPQGLATPYNGPGGTLPGDCGIPVGPIAYNISSPDGSGTSCAARTVVVGFTGTIKNLKPNVFGAGYINLLTEPGNTSKCSYTGPKSASLQTGSYGEYKPNSFEDAKSYIDCQILHWKSEAAARGQKCIPVDIDNCDSVGPDFYKKVLDEVESMNNAGAKVKVFVKNPHDSNCSGGGKANFFTHSAAIGAFVEAASPEEAQQLNKMRNPGQVILFANILGDDKLKAIENLKIPNTAFTYGKYSTVSNCTYNP